MESAPTNEKLFKCGLCDKDFSRKPDLSLHVRKSHNMNLDEYYRTFPILDSIMEEYLRGVVRKKSEVNESTNCWIWTGGVHGSYGRYGDEFAHKLSYRVFVGLVQDGLLVCHSCNNSMCVNPDHLYSGTQYDNMEDRRNAGNYDNFKHTEETKKKISLKLKGKKKPPTFISSIKSAHVVEKALATRRRKINYIFTSPNGTVFEVGILKEFCKEHGLCESNIFNVLAGRSSHHRGWKCERR